MARSKRLTETEQELDLRNHQLEITEKERDEAKALLEREKQTTEALKKQLAEMKGYLGQWVERHERTRLGRLHANSGTLVRGHGQAVMQFSFDEAIRKWEKLG